MIDRLQQSQAAGGAVVGHGHVHDVPGDCRRPVQLPAKLGEPAVVALDPRSGYPLRCVNGSK